MSQESEKQLTNTYYLVPIRGENGKAIGWSIKRGNAKRASKNTKTKAEAEEYIRSLAEKNEAHVVIYKTDGSVQKRYKVASKVTNK